MRESAEGSHTLSKSFAKLVISCDEVQRSLGGRAVGGDGLNQGAKGGFESLKLGVENGLHHYRERPMATEGKMSGRLTATRTGPGPGTGQSCAGVTDSELERRAQTSGLPCSRQARGI